MDAIGNGFLICWMFEASTLVYGLEHLNYRNLSKCCLQIVLNFDLILI